MSTPGSPRSFDVAVIGAGSGNVVVPEDGRTVALVESGDFGGTCVNRGCIPSKMFVHTADVAMQVRRAPRFGVVATLEVVEWRSIRDRIRAKIEATSGQGRRGRIESEQVTLFESHARFDGPHRLRLGDGSRIEAEQIVVAAGGSPAVPDVVTRSGVAYHTSDTVMWLEELPASMVVLGGGYVAAEVAHVFSSFGVDIRIVSDTVTLLEALDDEVSRRFTDHASKRWELHLGAQVIGVRPDGGDGAIVALDDGTLVSGELLLVATGRHPNTAHLGLETTDVALQDDGHIVVDEFGRAAEGIWALGDVSSPYELKHVANAEARTIAHNLCHPEDLRPLPHEWVPSAVFTDPQIASVGARSQDLEGRDYVDAVRDYRDTAYGGPFSTRSGSASSTRTRRRACCWGPT